MDATASADARRTQEQELFSDVFYGLRFPEKTAARLAQLRPQRNNTYEECIVAAAQQLVADGKGNCRYVTSSGSTVWQGENGDPLAFSMRIGQEQIEALYAYASNEKEISQ